MPLCSTIARRSRSANLRSEKLPVPGLRLGKGGALAVAFQSEAGDVAQQIGFGAEGLQMLDRLID